jgi:hypothetical protein
MQLLKSSYYFGIIHFIFMIITSSKNTLLNLNIIIGIVTSIINHGTTSDIAKYSDRVMMIIGIFIDIYVINNHLYYICYYTLSLSIASFLLSKYITYTVLSLYFHILSHLFLTVTHILLLTLYKN